jgi:simple sugar transport system ATP-binding protein
MTTLVARAVSKHFGTLRANDQISLTVRGGEVHALLGENGAGKSTLVAMLTGRIKADAGEFVIDGEPVSLGNPRDAASVGIAAVFQELLLVPSMTGLENLALGLGLPPNVSTLDRIREVQTEYGLGAPLDVPVRELELPMRQRLELLRALCARPRILLLDEPTTFLPPTEVAEFLKDLRVIADHGVAVMLITHRLSEARSIADCVTVLRDGRVAKSYERSHLPSDAALARAMVGEAPVEPQRRDDAMGDVILRCEGLVAVDERGHRVLAGVDLVVRRGEVLGLAGVDGNGQLPLLEVLAGLQRPLEGRISYHDEDVTARSFFARSAAGIRFVSGDRKSHGIIPTFDVAQHFEVVLGREVRETLHEILDAIGLVPRDPKFLAERLSGGNQQRLLIARVLHTYPEVLLLAYPTQGLDVRARVAVHELLLAARDAGRSIVFASTDLDEIFALSDRVAVMNRGYVTGVQERGEFNRQQVAEWFVGDIALRHGSEFEVLRDR